VILHVILASALSASAASPADSVRTAPKSSVARPDSVLLTLPAPTIRTPSQPQPSISRPVTLAWPTKRTDVKDSAPAEFAAQTTKVSAEPAKPSNEVVISRSSHVVVQSTAQTPPQPATQPAATPAAQPAVQASTPAVQAAVQPATEPAAAPAAQSVLAEVVQQAAAVKATPLNVAVAILAPADASAVALPPRTTAPAAPAAPITTADGRVVLGTRSTVVIEPMHAVPLPVVGVRLAPPSLADSIVVYKRERTLTLYLRGVPVRSYFVALGSRPVGDKISAGDDRTPEGLFTINAHNPASKYHLALRISYPDDAHRERAAKLGVDPGGDIMIHGLPLKFKDAGKDHRLDDWTNGCVALTNQEIEEIWRAVPDGTPIQIKP
jgi:hypothetical protein